MVKRNPEPRLLTQSQAAAYCGLCVETFKKACPVKPIDLLDRIARYDRQELDLWIDSMNKFRPMKDEEDIERMWHASDNNTHQGH
jgi:hypothetical protein